MQGAILGPVSVLFNTSLLSARGKREKIRHISTPRTFATRVFCLFVLLNSFIWLELVADFKEVKMAKVFIGLYFPGTLPRTRAGFASV